MRQVELLRRILRRAQRGGVVLYFCYEQISLVSCTITTLSFICIGICIVHVVHSARSLGVSSFLRLNEHMFFLCLTYTILPKVLGHPLLMKGLTTSVISMSTNLNV